MRYSCVLGLAIWLLAGCLSPARAATSVVCDGNGDTGELQAAVDNAPTAGRIVLSAGECVIEDTIVVASVRGLHIEGEGQALTRLKWAPSSPTNTGPLFSLERASEALFENFAIFVK